MFEDIAKSIKAYLYDRVSSPFLIAFIVAWSIWNYEALLIVFSEMATLEKITIIKNSVFPDVKCVLLKGMTYPFFSALAYVALGAYIEQLFYWLWLRKNRSLRKLKQKMDKERLLTREESRALMVKLANIEEAASENISALEMENQELKKIVVEKDEMLNRIQEELSDEKNGIDKNDNEIEANPSALESNDEKDVDDNGTEEDVLENDETLIVSKEESLDVNKLMIKIIKMLGVKGSIDEREVLSKSGMPHAITRHALNVLRNNNITNEFAGSVSLSDKGTAIVVRFKLV